MRDYPELLILRHGETEWNLEGRMQGALDSPLTETGEAQARRQHALLASRNLDGWALYCSPQERALATARIALGPRADEIILDERLMEIGVGAWAGRLRAELWDDVPKNVKIEDGPDGPLALYKYAPGGEGFAALRQRAERFLDDLSGPSVIVTHGITSRMLRGVVLGLPTDKIGDLPGGQGVVYHLQNATQTRLE